MGHKSYLSSTSGTTPSKIQTLAVGQAIKSRRSHWKHPGGSHAQLKPISSSDETCGPTALRHRPTHRIHPMRKLKAKPRFRKARLPHLKSLLSTVQTVSDTAPVPSLTNVLTTITDAWPSSNDLALRLSLSEMTHDGHAASVSHHVLERRRSVPEEVIRKFSVSHDKTSESETNATMPEITPPTSNDCVKKTGKNPGDYNACAPVRTRNKLERSFRVVEKPENLRSAEEGSSDSDSDAPGLQRMNSIKKAPPGSVAASMYSAVTAASDRASQSDYIRNGRGIINIFASEKASQTGDCYCQEVSDTTPSAREETESGERSASDILSSPRMCTRPISSSDVQSSDSEEIKCTCAEIDSSRKTSTDPNHSGKSTLSQTVSDNTTSTQDCTISIKSVSSGGSTVTAETETSSSDADPHTSAKETTDYDHTPRPPKGSGNNGYNTGGNATNGSSMQNNRNGANERNGNNNNASFTSRKYTSCAKERKMKLTNSCTAQTSPPQMLCHTLQQQIAAKIPYFDNNAQMQRIANTDNSTMSFEKKCDIFINSSKNYEDSDMVGLPRMVPRYSAMPKTMSMIVNASSFEANNMSDSDCQSLADSLEDGSSQKDVHYYYDTKQELKPVRGDYQPSKNKKLKSEPRGRAYFFSVDDEGVADLETNICKIPDMPSELKNKIQERHNEIHKKYENKAALQIKHSSNKPKDRTTRKRYIKKRGKPKEANGEESQSTQTVQSNDTQNGNSVRQHFRKQPDLKSKSDKGSLTFLSKIPTPIISKVKAKPIIKNDCQESPPSNKVNNRESKDSSQWGGDDSTTQVPNCKTENENCTSTEVNASIDTDELTRHRLSLISSLEATASMLKTQAQESENGNVGVPRSQPGSKRASKFRQKFEVIPEERSSSLSSADERLSERNRRKSLPVKFSESVEGPLVICTSETEEKTFRRYSLGSLPGYVIAKLMEKPLEAIPCIQKNPNNEKQQIIIFSPKHPLEHNSSKGRDALLAMNREDFERLSKGWMNFYWLKEDNVSECDKISKMADKGDKSQADYNTPSIERNVTSSESKTDHSHCTNNSILSQTTGSGATQPEELNVNVREKADITTCSNINPVEELKPAHLKLIKEFKSEDNSTNNILTNDVTNCANITNIVHQERKVKNSTKEASTITEKLFPRINKNSESLVELSFPAKLNSSNTVLKNGSKKSSDVTCSLPELKAQTLEKSPKSTKVQSLVETLPSVPGATVSVDSDADSDSTVYMEAPSPRLPKLPLDDCCCTSEDTSDQEELASKTMSSMRERVHLPLRRRPLPFRPKHRYGFYESVHGKKTGNSGWSVTVEGTMAFPRARPGVQMRLSFPDNCGGPPVVSQSDSGFVEERNGNSRASQQKQQWTVTVENPHANDVGIEKARTCHLPNLTQQQKQKGIKSSKKFEDAEVIDDVKSKILAVLPKIEKIIETELGTLTLGDNKTNPPLSVEGRTISISKKAPKLTERNLPRSHSIQVDYRVNQNK